MCLFSVIWFDYTYQYMYGCVCAYTFIYAVFCVYVNVRMWEGNQMYG